jgi:anaerobic selenocysteine-containing dehydrogenase
MSTTLNQGHFLGRGAETIIFPVLARDEESQTTTQESMFNFVRRSSGGTQRFEGPRSEVSVIVELAQKGIGKIQWKQFDKYDAIRQLISKCVSGFNPNEEHQILGRTFHSPKFSTCSGRIHAKKVPIHSPTPVFGNQLRVMTIRSEGQFNTVVYEEEDVYRGQHRRDIIMMNEQDANTMNLKQDMQVCVRGSAGELNVFVRCIDIAVGNCAMYFPEANVLLSHDVDSETRTPLFNGEVVSVEPI